MTKDEVVKELTGFEGARYVLLADKDSESMFQNSYPIVFDEETFYQQFPWGAGNVY